MGGVTTWGARELLVDDIDFYNWRNWLEFSSIRMWYAVVRIRWQFCPVLSCPVLSVLKRKGKWTFPYFRDGTSCIRKEILTPLFNKNIPTYWATFPFNEHGLNLHVHAKKWLNILVWYPFMKVVKVKILISVVSDRKSFHWKDWGVAWRNFLLYL